MIAVTGHPVACKTKGNMAYDQSEIDDLCAEIESEDGQASSRIVTALSSQSQYPIFSSRRNIIQGFETSKSKALKYAVDHRDSLRLCC